MFYEVVLTAIAEDQLDNILQYIIKKFRNEQAANSIIDDVEDALDILEDRANIFALCEEPELAKHGYYRFHLRKHNYILLYRIVGNIVYVDRIYHELQDYKNLE